jgi:hypothetical protein
MAVKPWLFKKSNGTYRARALTRAIETHNNAIVASTQDPNQRSLGCYQPVARPFFVNKNGRLKDSSFNRSEKSFNACLAGEERTGGIANTAEDAWNWAMTAYDQLTNPAGLTADQSEQAFALRDDSTSLNFKKAGLSGPVMWGAIGLLGAAVVLGMKKAK